MRKSSLRFGMIAILLACFGLMVAHPAYAASPVGALNPMLSWFAGLAMTVAEVIGRLVVAVLDLTIPLMQYQGFTTSPVVVAGWAIVRDVVNMFFVVVLIVIAMGTIFGGSKFQWKQQVPKLMLFAIVINFSKTLCGIMIDFAQVVMLTFANALKDIAGGNFIQLLGLGPIFSLSEEAANNGVISDAFGLFAASAAAVLMMVWVLAVVIMLLFILVYRIVMLWILIVIAPLAWFMGGQSVFKSDAYAEWWKNFICYTAIGPVIVFFLWLTLAVAGSGVIAANDSGFSSVLSADGSSPINNTSGNLTEIFELQHLASFVVGMAMLMAGFDAAAKICSGVKGPGFQAMLSMGKGVPGKIGGFVGGQSRKYGGKALSAGWSGGKSLAAGTGAGLLAATVGGGSAGDRLQRMMPTRAGQAARAEGLRAGSKKMPGFLAGTARSMSKAADERQADLAKTMKEKAEETYKGASDETKVDELIRLANAGVAGKQRFEGAATKGLLAEALKNPKMREKLEAAGVLGNLVRDHLPDLKKELKGTKDYDAIEEFEAGRPDLTGNFKGLNTMDDVEKIDPAGLAHLKDEADRKTALGAAFEARMKAVKSNTKRKFRVGETLPDGVTVVTAAMGETVATVTAWEHFEGGMGSVKKQKAWKEGMRGVYEGMGKPALDLVPVDELARNPSADLVSRRGDLAQHMLASRAPGRRFRMGNDRPMVRSAVGSQLGATYNAAGTVTAVNASTLNAAVKKDVNVVTNIPTDEIEGNAELAAAVGNAYGDGELKKLVKAYTTANDDDRRAMDETVFENVFRGLEIGESTATAAGETARAAELSTRRSNLISQLERAEGGRADMVTAINNRVTDLRADEARHRAAGNTQGADQLAEATRRLINRRARH